MTTSSHVHDACQSAADLFSAAGRRLDLPPLARLECLAAEQALQATGHGVDARMAALGSESLIHAALDTLSGLSLAEFRDPRVRNAARHARQALREQQTWPAR